VLAYGRAVLPAIGVGSLAADLLLSPGGTLSQTSAVLAVLSAVGAVLQAWFGAFLIERMLRRPLELGDPPQVLRFLAAGLISGTISAVVATLAWHLAGAVPSKQLPMLGATWWLGSLFGTWVITPAVMT
jgi:integral membrane sensor domain MASE1